MTPAMIKAMDLHAYHPPRRSQWDEPNPEAIRKNRIRQSLTLDSWPHKIAAFRSLFCLDQHNLSYPAILSDDRKQLHFGLMDEEDRELSEAWGAGDVLGVADAVLDGIYVRLGLLAEMGFSPDLTLRLMEEIHASNLTKTDDTGQPIINGINRPADPSYPVGKVLKGEHYTTADLGKVLVSYLGDLTTHPADDTVGVPDNTEDSNG